jgi:hypothetical protein
MRIKSENNIWKNKIEWWNWKKKSKFYKRIKDKNYKPKEYGINPKTKQIEEQLWNFEYLGAKTIE